MFCIFSRLVQGDSKENESRTHIQQSVIVYSKCFLVDNLIKLFIVDIYHVIKHATLCAWVHGFIIHTYIYALVTSYHCHSILFLCRMFLVALFFSSFIYLVWFVVKTIWVEQFVVWYMWKINKNVKERKRNGAGIKRKTI